MGKTFAEQLAQRGLVSQASVDRLEQERRVEEMNAGRTKTKDAVQLKDLDKAADMYEFGQIAQRILLDDPTIAGVIVAKAHRFKNNDPTAKAFIWRMYRVRDLLKACPEEKRERFLARAFRRHEPTVDIPE